MTRLAAESLLKETHAQKRDPSDQKVHDLKTQGVTPPQNTKTRGAVCEVLPLHSNENCETLTLKPQEVNDLEVPAKRDSLGVW